MTHNIRNKVTRSRFKIKPNDKISIYDIFIIKMLRDTTDELYLYVDDRTMSSQNTQKGIDDVINILKLFDIKLPEMIVRYTDYYETAWIYLHRLVTLTKALLNYSTICRPGDLHMMTKSKNVKIFYDNKDKNNRYDNILYDCGWYRDIFIEILMDYSERIDKIVDELDIVEDGRHILSTNLCKDLNFSMPEKLFTNLIMTIKHINGNSSLNKQSLSNILSNISIEHIHKLGIDMIMIRDMLENNKDSLLDYAHKIDLDYVRIIFDQNKEIILPKLCLANSSPCEILLDKSVVIKGVKLDISELKTLQLDPQNLQSIKIRIKSLGCIEIENKYPDYTGIIKKSRKVQKQKNIKIISMWTPIICDEPINDDIIIIPKTKISNILNASNIMYNIDSKLYVLDTNYKPDSLNHTLISWDMMYHQWIQMTPIST